MNLIVLVGMLVAVSAQAPSSVVDAETDVVISESTPAISRSSAAVSITGEWKAVPMNLPPAPKFWPPDCGNISNQTQADRCAQYQAVREARFSGVWAMLSMGMTAVAIVLAGLGWWDNRKTQRLEHQAYLRMGFYQINVGWLKFSKLEFELENYGRTPARGIEAEVIVRIYDSRDEEAGEIGRMHDVLRVDEIHPGRLYKLPISLGAIPTDAVQAVMSDFAFARVSVWLHYIDVFNTRHSMPTVTGDIRFKEAPMPSPHSGRLEGA